MYDMPSKGEKQQTSFQPAQSSMHFERANTTASSEGLVSEIVTKVLQRGQDRVGILRQLVN